MFLQQRRGDRKKREQQCLTNLYSCKAMMFERMSTKGEHDCLASNLVCNPENELNLLHRNALRQSSCSGINYMYMCNMGMVHTCTTEKCSLWVDTGVCPLTGIVHGQVFQTGKDRSGHYVRGSGFGPNIQKGYARGSSRHINSFNGFGRSKRRVSLSDSSVDYTRKHPATKRVKMMSSGNWFRKSGSGVITIEREVKQKRVPAITKQQRDLAQQVANRSEVRIPRKLPSSNPVKDETEKREAAQPVRRKVSKNMMARFEAKTQKLITNLLYGDTRRKLNKKAESDAQKKWESLYSRYQALVKEEGRQETFKERYEIALNSRAVLPFQMLENDGKLIRKYVSIVKHVWAIVRKYGPASYGDSGDRVCVQMTLGTLYSMRNSGIIVGNTMFLPRNPELHHLPTLQLLNHFRQAKGKVASYNRSYTQGANAIRAAYEAAVKQGVPHSILVIDSAILAPEETKVNGKRLESNYTKSISRRGAALAEEWENDYIYLTHEQVYDQIVKDGACRKNPPKGAEQTCKANLLRMNQEAAADYDSVVSFLAKKLPQMHDTEIRLAVDKHRAWQSEELYRICLDALTKA